LPRGDFPAHNQQHAASGGIQRRFNVAANDFVAGPAGYGNLAGNLAWVGRERELRDYCHCPQLAVVFVPNERNGDLRRLLMTYGKRRRLQKNNDRKAHVRAVGHFCSFVGQPFLGPSIQTWIRLLTIRPVSV
jgi:hypothetical protein